MRDRDRLLRLLEKFGTDAVSFLAVESGMQHWFEEGPDGETTACIAYADTGRAWVAAGRPLTEPSRVSAVAAAFVESARANGRSACFFASEDGDIDGFASLLLGEQPVWRTTEWESTRARHRRLREQIRRATAKGVRIRRVDPHEVEPGSPLRAKADALAAEWLSSRHMEPMAFLVALEPFHLPERHRYYAAERDGRLVELLSAVPIHAARGWLVEDVVRSRRAPNGTTEAVLDAMMRDASDSDIVTLGLAPLSGPVSFWLRLARIVSSPFYDFGGIRAFKQRLWPTHWQKVWLAFPRAESAAPHVVEALRAFAGGSLLAFAVRSMARHPSGPPWALALPLVPWIAVLTGLAVTGRADVLGFSRTALIAWIAFDAVLTLLLMRSAARPRPGPLACSAAAAAVDAAWSVRHLVRTGLGATVARTALRGLAAVAPCLGATALAWATMQAIERSRG